MARKKFNLIPDDEVGPSPPRKKKAAFDNPLEQTRSGRRKAARVAGRKTDAAGRIRKTIFLDPVTIDEIEAIAEAEGYRKMDFYEWLVLVGLQQFDRGMRPQVVDEPVVKARIRIDR
ncbi:MAG: hypothetical protein D6706_13000 [Chloroflexi bacterium]|nr:MAG: hypothetical protein D6706_13000 [Chloroflexota bacterium]